MKIYACEIPPRWALDPVRYLLMYWEPIDMFLRSGDRQAYAVE